MKIKPIKIKIDDRGRLVMPSNIRKIYEMKPQEEVEVYPTEEGILIKKED